MYNVQRHIPPVPCNKNAIRKRGCAKILEQCIRSKVEPLQSKDQFGFRKCSGCTDAIFALKQLRGKETEYNQKLQNVFVEMKKSTSPCWPNQIIEDLWILLNSRLTSVQHSSHITLLQECSTNNKWKTQLVSSNIWNQTRICIFPFLFIIYNNHITKEASPDKETINKLLFIDDHMLLHRDKEILQWKSKQSQQLLR